MKQTLIVLSLIVAVILILIGASGFLIQLLMSSSAKDSLLAGLSKQAGVPVTANSVRFDLAAWYQLKPALALDKVMIGNPPGFLGQHMVEAETVGAQVRLSSLFGPNIEVLGIDIEKPRILLEKNREGRTNLDAFLKNKPGHDDRAAAASAPGEASQSGSKGLVIGRLSIRQGELSFSGFAAAPSVHDVNITLSDFAPGQPFHLECAARLYSGNRSAVRVEGQAGPITATAAPLSAHLRLELAPAEIPADVRKRELGDLLAEPGPAALVSVEATVKGDLYGNIAGPASLRLENVMVGSDRRFQMPMTGKAPVQIELRSVTSSMGWRLRVTDGTLNLGNGGWQGSLDVASSANRLQGSSRGSIRNVDANQFLRTFSTPNNRVEGVLAIPSYNIQFSGTDSNQLKRSLAGAGRMEITKGRIDALNLIASIQSALNKTTGSQSTGNTDFSTLTSDVVVGNGALRFSNIMMAGPQIQLSGDGVLGFDESIGFHLTARVGGALPEIAGIRDQSGKSEVDVPMDVSGTVSNPVVRPNVSKLLMGTGMDLLNQFLGKKNIK